MKDSFTTVHPHTKTPLHGARWLWFGPASLGRNDWQDFGTALVIGREDIGVDALEDYARSLFGDTGVSLQFVQPNEKGSGLSLRLSCRLRWRTTRRGAYMAARILTRV